jgi:PAS domain S-box-containing protein
MEEAIRAGEELRAAVLDNVQDAIFYVQVEGESRYRFISVNRAFTRLFGVSDVEIVGKTLDEILPSENLARALARYDTVVRTRQPQTWEEAISARTGQKHGDVALIPIFSTNGRCTNLVGTVHDVTARIHAESERTKLQTQLHQAQRMQALGTLAGGIAHDFNSILAAIVGNTTLALQDVQPGSQARDHLTEVEKASRRAVELVRQILTFSRSTPPVYKIMDPRTVTAEALKMLRATLPKKICIETHVAPDTPRINADATQFHQVIMNLTTNAAHAFNNASGVIEVSLNRAISDQLVGKAASQLAPGTYLRLRVMDRGSGMEAATLKQVFDPFFTTRAPGEGTGLGLSVVHGIVENHHGAIDIESKFGFGTTATVYLPASEGSVAASQSSRSIRGGGERILYVDDEEPLVVLMDRALTRMGYRVSGYVDPVAALEEFRKQPFEFDVVITDLAMPGLPGPKLATELRKIRSDVPIIMTSGYIRQQDREVAEQLQINQLVYKSNTIEQLGEVLAAEIAIINGRNGQG